MKKTLLIKPIFVYMISPLCFAKSCYIICFWYSLERPCIACVLVQKLVFLPKNWVFGRFLENRSSEFHVTWSESWNNCFESSASTVVTVLLFVVTNLGFQPLSSNLFCFKLDGEFCPFALLTLMQINVIMCFALPSVSTTSVVSAVDESTYTLNSQTTPPTGELFDSKSVITLGKI